MHVLTGPELVIRADEIAVAAHAGATYGGRPYIEHPREVAALARALGYPPEVEAAGLLHDTIEDTDETAESLLAQGMPLVVVEGVEAVTYDGNGSLADKIAKAMRHPIGRVVKFCDSGRNFATTVNDPEDLGSEERALRYAIRYGSNIGTLAVGLPTPAEIREYLRTRTEVTV